MPHYTVTIRADMVCVIQAEAEYIAKRRAKTILGEELEQEHSQVVSVRARLAETRREEPNPSG